MQTLSVQIQDSYLQNFLDYIESHSDKITLTENKNLEYDPYYYERKEELERAIEESENGTMEMLSQEQYDKEMEIFFKDLKANADF